MKKTLLPLRRRRLWFTYDTQAPRYGTPLLTNELRLKIRKRITKKKILLVETLVNLFLEIQHSQVHVRVQLIYSRTLVNKRFFLPVLPALVAALSFPPSFLLLLASPLPLRA
jgi:hypothetical protein